MGLTTFVKKLKQNLPNYYYFLTDHGKKKNGTTRHLFADVPKLIYHEIQDNTSIVNWLTGAIKQEPIDVGSKFIRNNNNA